MRPIDADALLLEFGEEPLNWTNSDSEIQAQRDYRLFTKIVKDAPTVDIKTEVAEVVRCKDCEHWEATDDGISRNNKGRTDGVCERLWSIHCAERHLTERDHYCGYGRRKTQKEGVEE